HARRARHVDRDRGGCARAAVRPIHRPGAQRVTIARVIDADALFADSRRPIAIGIGGGGDVVGALATAEALRLYSGADPGVGGDASAHGDEPGLASPLCDAVLLAAGARLQASGHRVLGAIFGPGCDGELTPAEAGERLAEVGAAGGLAGARGLTPPVADRVEAAAEVVPTEASLQ